MAKYQKDLFSSANAMMNWHRQKLTGKVKSLVKILQLSAFSFLIHLLSAL
jgi:hypothetical protein